MKRILIIGDNPLKNVIIRQYNDLGVTDIIEQNCDFLELSALVDVDEFVILGDSSASNAVVADNVSMKILMMLAESYSSGEGVRPRVHLLLLSPASCWMIQTMDMPEVVNDKFEVYPFTIEDEWAKNVLVQLPGKKDVNFPVLDRTRIAKDSNTFVHIVISGFDSQASAVAVHTALVAHYPNYSSEDSQPLRTRVTIIDEDVIPKRDKFVAKHQCLFDNSFYRTIDIAKHTVDFHRPMYDGKRADFVDVEWEFVCASVNNPEVLERISRWAEDERQQLAFFVCHDDDGRNLSECMALPRSIYDRGVPVMVQQSCSGLLDSLSHSNAYRNVRPFGMKDNGYDITLPLVRLAKYLNYFYDCSYGNAGVPIELPIGEVEKAWQNEKSFKMRLSNIYNVMTIATKMRSLGYDVEDADTFYALTREEIESLAETEHNRWNVERLILGVRPCTDKEIVDIRTDVESLKKVYKKMDIHFDLRAYNELEEDGTGKNVQVYDCDLSACIPLIIKAFYEDSKHGK